jgi:hypothetical protein
MRTELHTVIGSLLAALAPVRDAFAEVAVAGDARMKGFGLAEGPATPAFGRILVVFALIAALAWGCAWALRRFAPRFGLGQRFGVLAGSGAAGEIRQLARSSLPGGVACHLVEVQGSRVMITVTRQGVSTVMLGATPPASERVP